jgi:hypothetical protein
MALRVAVANGNWSSTSTWNGGVLPAAGDVVASNGFTVTIDQNVNVDSITNTATTVSTAVPIMTSNTTPSGIARSNVGVAWQAFDSNSSYWLAQTTVPGDYVEYEFPTAKAIDQYYFTNGTTFSGSVSLQAWNGTTWITLHTAASVTLPNAGNYTYTSPSIGNTTAYIKYRFVVNSALYVQIHTVGMYEALSVSALQGGTFNLNSGVTVTCTGASGITAGPVACMIYSGTGSSIINANINPTVSNVDATTLIHNSTGTLTLNGNIFDYGLSNTNRVQTVLFSGSGVFNITGNITGLQIRTGLNITGTGTCNILGSLYPANAGSAVTVAGNAVVNITGTIYPNTGGSTFNGILIISAVSAIVTFTGNVASDTNIGYTCNGIYISGTSRLNVIGNVYAGSSGAYAGIYAVGACYIDMIGTIKPNRGVPAFYSTNSGAINVLSGPFISGDSGIQPFYVTRMHYRRTMGSYFEFRDNSTNGALPPAGSAPATRLVSPDTAADSPIPANVRQGKSYALGSQTGTMIVPNPANVVKNVPVDNTVGTGALDPSAIWAVPLSALTTNNSIGQIVKKVATVETTGAQIQSTLNNNP